MSGDIFILVPDLETAVTRAQILFEATREKLIPLLPSGTQIEHIGATAIPGCITKGDLDIAVRVEAAHFEMCRDILSEQYQGNLGSIRTSTFAAFMDERTDPPLGIQLSIIGSEFDFFTRFRDRLRSDSALVDRYNDLKRNHEGANTETYLHAKSRFIDEVLSSSTD